MLGHHRVPNAWAGAGVHGASLTFTAYLEPGRAALLEVVPAVAWQIFQHYHNIAHNNEVLYRAVCTEDHVYTTNVTEALWEVMREVAVMRAAVAPPGAP